MCGASPTGADLSGSVLNYADLSDAHLGGAILRGCSLKHADLSRANLTGVDFQRVSIEATRLEAVQFAREHPSSSDGSDSIRLALRDRLLSWARLRSIGRFPLFAVSWTAFTLALIAVNLLGFVNSTSWVQESVGGEIPIPYRMGLILVSSLLLVGGSTLYKAACPSRVQEFSEAEWVDRLGHPRLVYLAESLRHRWQWMTFLLTVCGGGVAVFLIGERVWLALRYLWSSF